MRKIKQFIFDFWIILFLWYKPWSESLTKKKKKNRKNKKKWFFFKQKWWVIETVFPFWEFTAGLWIPNL